MIRKIFCTLMVVLLSTAAFGQSGKSSKEIRQQYFVFGPKVGLSSPYQNIVTNTTALKQMLAGANLGMQVGGYARGMLPLKKTKLMLYAQLDASWAMDFYLGGGGKASAGYFNFPLLVGAGYKLSDELSVRAAWGPTYSINIYSTANPSFKGENDKYSSEIATLIERDPWGWAADLGVDWKSWTLDVRYINQFQSHFYTRIADETRYISWGLTLGYRF